MKPPRTYTLCLHCHEPILNRPKQARYHGYDHPACYAASQEDMKAKERKARARQKDERRDPIAVKRLLGKYVCPRKCGVCKYRKHGLALLPEGFHHSCPEYRSRHSNRMVDDEYIYEAWAYSGYVKPRAQEEMEVER